MDERILKNVLSAHIAKYDEANSYLLNTCANKKNVRLSDEMEVKKEGYRIDYNNSVVTKNNIPVFRIEKKYYKNGNVHSKLVKI